MREINNNKVTSNNTNFKNVQQKPSADAVQPEDKTFEYNADKTDLNKMPSEVIGRSQVAKTAAEKDVEFFYKNPEFVERSMEFFKLCEIYGKSPVEAAELMGAYAKEFIN